jgi:hypothetical protein
VYLPGIVIDSHFSLFSKNSSEQNNDGDNNLIEEGTTMPIEQQFEASRQRGCDTDVLMAEFLGVQDQQHVCPSISLFLHSTAQTQPNQKRGRWSIDWQLPNCSHFLRYRQVSSAIF